MWEAFESEVNSWFIDSLPQPSKKLKIAEKKRLGKQKKADKNCEGTVPRIRKKRPKARTRTQMLKLFAVILFTCRTMYNKTIIRFGFCDIRNNQGLGNHYQPQPPASADNGYLDLDYSGYRKNLIQ